MSDRRTRYPAAKQPNCPDCGIAMETGFIPDTSNAFIHEASSWVSGEAKEAFWNGLDLKGRLAFPIRSYRCSRCGLLREYAFTPSFRHG